MLKVIISHQIKKETFWFRLAYIKAKKAWKKVCPLMRDPSFKAWQRTDKEKKSDGQILPGELHGLSIIEPPPPASALLAPRALRRLAAVLRLPRKM